MLNFLLALISKLFKPMPEPVVIPPVQAPAPLPETNAERLVRFTKAALGENLSLGTGVPSEVACAVSVNIIHTRAFGFAIGGGASTNALYHALQNSPDFKKSDVATLGSIVISPTGYGSKAAYPHGHVGIVGKYGICSNDSSTGLFSQNYTVDSWKHQFGTIEGYPVFYFKRI